MIRNTQIIKVDQDKITVRFGNQASCKDCNCLFKGFGDVDFDTSVMQLKKNQVSIGDTAVVDIPDQNIAIAPFVVFVFPLIAIGLGLTLGSIWGIVYQIVLMLVFFAISLSIVCLFDSNIKSKIRFSMVLKEVVSKSEFVECNGTTCDI
ncbi:MAG: SoxR reducing system RseC family protein [Firmicutes bacterium]|nr:SoxR reducing system RseC family protein [Bacillota bacterium]MCL1954061.1 SoxR reducing system RseC family protein [Bacillota bacterium]